MKKDTSDDAPFVPFGILPIGLAEM